jgi:hypothetical protein
MKCNVSSFKVANAKGHAPGLYAYDPEKIPLGEFDAVLDFKTWSKRIVAVNCYFTKVDIPSRFVATVYCNYQTGTYKVGGSSVDFSTCPIGAVYHLIIGRNNKGKVILLKAEFIGLPKVF